MKVNPKLLAAYSAATFLALTSCADNRRMESAKVADFAHVASEFMTGQTDIEQAHDYIAHRHSEFDAMYAIMGLDATDDSVASWLSSAPVRWFYNDIDSISPSGETIGRWIGHIVSESQREHLELPAKSFATAIWGKTKSIMFADSVMIVALIHYLGSEHPAYSGMPAYLSTQKSPERIPYDIAEALVATAYPFESSGSTSVINRLIYEGAVTLAKMRLVDNSRLEDALGYTDEELKWLNDNEAELWNKMLTSKMVFDKSETTAEKLLSPAPFTSVLSQSAPGRAGRYIGYKIVMSYVDSHSGTTLQQLLSPPFYGQDNPLKDTGYAPGR